MLHIAEKSPALSPQSAEGKARMRTWVFAALNSIEPFMMNLAEIDFFSKGESWAKERRPQAVESLKDRLDKLSVHLKGKK